MILGYEHFDPSLALLLARIVHDRCHAVPHDIGIQLAQTVRQYQLNKKQTNDEDDRFDPVCRKCGDPLTTEELICGDCITK